MHLTPKNAVPCDGKPAPTLAEIHHKDAKTREARERLEAAINDALAESAAKRSHPSAQSLQTIAPVISLYKHQRARLLAAPRTPETDAAQDALEDIWAEA